DLDQALDVERHLPAKVTLDLDPAVDHLAQAVDLLLGQIAHPGVRVDAGRLEDLLAGRQSDAVDVGEGDLDPLPARDVDAGDTCHVRLPLALLVLRIAADDHHGPVATDDLAVVATRLDRRSDLHGRRSLLESVGDAATGEVVRRKFHPDPVTWQDPDEVHPKLAADVGEDVMAVLELDPEHRVRERFDDRAFDFDRVLLSHRASLD